MVIIFVDNKDTASEIQVMDCNYQISFGSQDTIITYIKTGRKVIGYILCLLYSQMDNVSGYAFRIFIFLSNVNRTNGAMGLYSK